MKVATLFSGGGILDCAIKKVFGVEPAIAVEYDVEVADVYRENYPDTNLIVSPIEAIDWNQVEADGYYLVHGSPSCKNFSQANPHGIESEMDIAAAQGFTRAIERLSPKYVTLEQVRGYTKSRSWEIIVSTLKRLGYELNWSVVNSCNYGVPQYRERIILVGCKERFFLFPSPEQAVGWGDTFDCSVIADMQITSPTGNQIAAYEKAIARCGKHDFLLVPRRGYRSKLPPVRGRKETAPTITCSIFTDGKGASRNSFFDIVDQNGVWRSLSVRHMADLQTIPRSYKLPLNTRIAGKIIGNGVPPALYEKILMCF